MKTILLLALLLPALSHAGAPGFSSDIDKTLAAAKKEKKPVIIDFFGIWCPPCNELDETVFESSRFIDKAKAFKLLRVDADAKASWKLKDRYKIGGYPTVVFANPKGDEIYRVVGYRTEKEMLKVMDLVLAAKGKDLAQACKSSDTDDLWRCASICSERKDNRCAAAAFGKLEKKLKPGSARYQMARSYAVDASEGADAKRDGYERLITEMPDSPLALIWADQYLGAFEDSKGLKPKPELVEKVLANAAKISADPNLEEEGLTQTDVAEGKATLLDKLGKSDDAKAAWKEAAALLEKQAAALPKDSAARGFTLERIECLQESGDVEGALKLANEYRAKFPGEFTFHFWAARLLHRAKKYTDALPAATKAYELSYGDNKIRAATLLVELYSTVPDKEAAKKVYEDVTKEIKPEASLEIRTHRYLKKLDETMKKLGA